MPSRLFYGTVAFFFVALIPSLLAQANFAPVTTYDPAGYGSGSVALADVNKDGKPDLLVSNPCGNDSNCAVTSNGTVGVLLGNGDGTFETAMTYSSGVFGAFSVAVADVNGDKNPDILVLNRCASSSDCYNGSVAVLLGNGDGTFQAGQNYGVGKQPMSMTVADVNGDGRADLLLANYFLHIADGGVTVLLGNGDGTFQTPGSYSSDGDNTYSLAVGDINGDRKPDVVVTSYCSNNSVPCTGGGVGVLIGNGDGTFQTAVRYASGGNIAQAVAITDFNGDGKPDLVVDNCAGSFDLDCRSTSNSTIGVLLGTGDSNFQAAIAFSSGGTSTHALATADVNGDGHQDIITTNNNAGIGVLLGNGDGTFQPSLAYNAGAFDAVFVALADVNGDGKPDIVVRNACADSTCATNYGPVGVLINTTPSRYEAFVQQPIDSDGSSTFRANRGVVPVKFTLTRDNIPTCQLPEAKIGVSRIGNGTSALVDESTYSMSADSGSDFRIDLSACQYVYNIAASAVGVGLYSADIRINGWVVGNAVFALK